MVNTFITSLNDPTFSKSAANLDRARLGKQRVEAMQIYNIIDRFDQGCAQLDLYSRPTFPKCGMQASRTENPVETYHVRIKFFMDNIQEIKKNTSLKLGWFGHPAVKMWIGYKEALGLYINACIDEWVKRGYVNKMKRYDVSSNGSTIVLPWWLNFKGLIQSHCAALVNKEIAREEKEWYLNPVNTDTGVPSTSGAESFTELAGDYIYYGYVWVWKLLPVTIDQILNTQIEPYPHEVADEISDAIDREAYN